MVMTTSNVTGKIDLAFVDRADMKVHIGLPSSEAIYEIFRSSIEELQRTGIIERRGALVGRNLSYRKKTVLLEANEEFDEGHLLKGRVPAVGFS